MTVIKVIIPAFNEQESVVRVVQDIPADKVDEIVVVNNNSTDMTARVAQQAGVTVVDEPRRGYGYACLAGMDYIAGQELLPDIIVFMDADYSDHPEELPKVVAPISNEGMDLVIGTRKKDLRERGSMTFPQVFGNWLATRLMRLIYGSRFTDLGPFRAIRYDRLMTFGWKVLIPLSLLNLLVTSTLVVL